MNLIIKQGGIKAIVLFAVVSQSVMAEESEVSDLSPQQLKQVQAVSQAVLAMKRSVKPSDESVMIRKQLRQVKVQLDKLIEPKGTVVLQQKNGIQALAAASINANPTQSISEQDEQKKWRREHSNELQQLESGLTVLKERCDDEITQRSPVQLGLVQRIKAMVFNDKTASNLQPNEVVVTSLSDAALQKLSQLQVDIDTALALPEQERYQQLNAISKRLQIARHVTETADNEDQEDGEDQIEDKETPTFISRTSHRREY